MTPTTRSRSSTHSRETSTFLAGDIGFWQGALRDPTTTEFADVRRLIESRERIIIDILYGDHEGGQRVITRFSMTST